MSRYSKNKKGKIIKIADIYTYNEHKIDIKKIDREVFQIARRLKEHGYEAYLVGGAVRDLLLGSRPKDFDIVTDAMPSEIRGFIKNSRIIGKRFRLVHIFYPGGKIIEVITFRALDSGAHNPLYGTIEEDVQRRDFSVNALYYDLNNAQIVDFVGAIADFRKRQMRNIIDLPQIFREDPVRIIRCLKYATKIGFKVPRKILLQIQRDAQTLHDCSKSRLAEELGKILCSEYCDQILEVLQRYGILDILLPRLCAANFPSAYKADFVANMQSWQQLVEQHNQAEEQLPKHKRRIKNRNREQRVSREMIPEGYLGENLLGLGFSYLFNAYFTYSGQWDELLQINDAEQRSMDAYSHFKECLNDLNISNMDVLTACEQLFLREGLRFEPRLIFKKYERLGGSRIKRRGAQAARPKNPTKGVRENNEKKNTVEPILPKVSAQTSETKMKKAGQSSGEGQKTTIKENKAQSKTEFAFRSS